LAGTPRTTCAGTPARDQGENILYHNNGDAHVTAKAGVGGSGCCTEACFVDYDRAGRLDLIFPLLSSGISVATSSAVRTSPVLEPTAIPTNLTPFLA
jgi:hypothetical protein